MVIVGMISWWYSRGWYEAFLSLKNRFVGLFDYFSIDLLLKTLFSPFRQISAGRIDGPIGLQMRALVDRLISRLIGAFMRIIVIIIGLITLFLVLLLGIFYLIFWLVIPVLPIFGLILMLTGWIPWTL